MNRKSVLSPQFKDLRVAVFLGGLSSESKISRKSGKGILNALRAAGMQASPVDPARNPSASRLKSSFDIVFLALHGRGGEDGKIQRWLERIGLPYTGAGPAGSRLSFDKAASKQVFVRTGIPTPDYRILKRSEPKSAWRKFSFPVFVKPCCDGSSIGVHCLDNEREAVQILPRLFKRYDQLIVESKVEGREFTVGLLGGRALPVVELLPKREFYDFKAKYTKGMTRYQVPAKIPKSSAKVMQQIARKVMQELDLRDFCRIDMMMDRAGRIYVLEANSIPGMTEFSLVPKAAAEAGITYQRLCLQILKHAWNRHLAGKRLYGEKKKTKKESYSAVCLG